MLPPLEDGSSDGLRMKYCDLVQKSETDPNQTMADHDSLGWLYTGLGDCHGLYPPLQSLVTL